MTDDTPRISVIVPAYNASSTVAGCLRALAEQETDQTYEVIMVDDGSTDDTARLVGAFAPKVRLLRQQHSGAAAARNLGAAAARGDLLLFTDADCEPTPHWVQTLANALRDADGAKGTYRTHQRSLVARWVQAEYESKYRRMAQRATIDFIDTYSAGYRRAVFNSVGGFNEALEVDEDQELSFRLAEAHARLVFTPEAVVYHRHVSSPQAYARRKFRIGYWKVLVAAMHPSRIVSDSHTPQSVKAQMALLAFVLLLLPATPFSRPARKVSSILAAVLIASTSPISLTIARRDPTLAAAAPGMSLLRAASHLAGSLAGLARFGPDLLRRRVSTSTDPSSIKYNRTHD